MGIEFDSANKLIKMTSPTVVISALSMYSSAMNWCSNIQNIGYTVPMKAVGKFPLGGNINSDSIFILINNWKIKWYDGNYTAVITGTLITDDETSRTVPPDSGSVETVFTVASFGTIAESRVLARLGGMIEDVDGDRYTQKSLQQIPTEGLTEEEHNHLMNAVALEETTQTIKEKTGTINWSDIDFIKAIEGGRWKVINNQMIFYKDDNGTVVATFDLYDSNGNPSIINVAERRRVQR